MMRKNFFIISNRIFDLGLKPIPFSVYCCLVKHRDEKSGSCFPSRKRIAQLCGISLQSVDNALKEIEGIGLIQKQEQYRANGSRTSNRYYLFEPCSAYKTDMG